MTQNRGWTLPFFWQSLFLLVTKRYYPAGNFSIDLELLYERLVSESLLGFAVFMEVIKTRE